MRPNTALLLALAFAACGTPTTSPGADAGAPPVDSGVTTDAGAALDAGPSADAGRGGSLLPRRHPSEADRAARGEAALHAAQGAQIPWMGLRSLWVVWGLIGLDDAAYWAEFSRRYGFVPREGAGPPYGVVQTGATGTIQCLACHVDRVAGRTLVGAGNGRLRISALYDDLVRLVEIAPMYGFTVPPIPDVWRDAFAGRTGAPGATDAFGMGMRLATAYGPSSGIETRYGFQQPPAWWQMAYKDRTYTDGAGSSHNFRTMLATTLASGSSLSDIMAMETAFEDVRHYLLSIDPPAWPFDAPDPAQVDAGRALFGAHCAGCHGTYGGDDASYPDRVLDVSTDPVRHTRLGPDEVDWINLGWFGDPPMQDTDGYLAPPLLGVWATAPYLHNGSVPDLRSLLRSSERPARWRRVAPSDDDYDPVRVGVRFEVGTVGDPLTYDTTASALSAAGHEFGSALSDAEVEALLAYLVTL